MKKCVHVRRGAIVHFAFQSMRNRGKQCSSSTTASRGVLPCTAIPAQTQPIHDYHPIQFVILQGSLYTGALRVRQRYPQIRRFPSTACCHPEGSNRRATTWHPRGSYHNQNAPLCHVSETSSMQRCRDRYLRSANFSLNNRSHQHHTPLVFTLLFPTYDIRAGEDPNFDGMRALGGGASAASKKAPPASPQLLFF